MIDLEKEKAILRIPDVIYLIKPEALGYGLPDARDQKCIKPIMPQIQE